MADKITDRQLARAIDWLEEKTEATCPFCRGRRWTVDDELSGFPSYQPGEPELQLDRGHTLVLVTCEQCGFTAPFSSKKLAI